MALACLNGQFLEEHLCVFPSYNRALRYGDSIFETIRIFNHTIPFWPYHRKRLAHAMNVLGIDEPEPWSNPNFLPDCLLHLAHAYQGNARIRLSLFREGEGLYAPPSPRIAWFASARAEEGDHFKQLPPKSWVVFRDDWKSCGSLANLKSGSALLYVEAGRFLASSGRDDCIILNQHARVAECLSSNIFWVKGSRLMTPPLSEGCVAGTIRDYLLQDSGLQVTEALLEEQELLRADELFCTNAIKGVQNLRLLDGRGGDVGEMVRERLNKRLEFVVK